MRQQHARGPELALEPIGAAAGERPVSREVRTLDRLLDVAELRAGRVRAVERDREGRPGLCLAGHDQPWLPITSPATISAAPTIFGRVSDSSKMIALSTNTRANEPATNG